MLLGRSLGAKAPSAKALAGAAVYVVGIAAVEAAQPVEVYRARAYKRQGTSVVPTIPTSPTDGVTSAPVSPPSSGGDTSIPSSSAPAPALPSTSIPPSPSSGGGGVTSGGTSAGAGGGGGGGQGTSSEGGAGGFTTRPTSGNDGGAATTRSYGGGGGGGGEASSVFGGTIPQTVTQVTVVSGVAVTQTLTVMPSQTVDPSLVDANSSSSGGFFDNTGAVVGVFLVVGLACAAILLGALFFWRRRKRQRELDEDVRIAASGAGAGGAGTNRFGDEDEDDDDGLPRSMNQIGSGPLRPNSALGGSHNYFALPTGGGMGQHGSGSDMTHHRTISSGSAGNAGVGGGGGYWPGPPGQAYGAGGLGALPGSNSRHNSMHEGAFGGLDPAQTPAGVNYEDWSEYINGGRGAPPNAGAPGGDSGSDDLAYAAAPGRGSDSLEGSSGGSQEKELDKKRASDATGSTLPVDQRLDARAMLKFMHEGRNESTDSLKDSNDYSRRILKVTNPSEDA